jgi:hypothetical protein
MEYLSAKARLGPVIVILLLVLIAAGVWLILHLIYVKSPELIRDLSSPDPDVVHDSLVVLKDRHDDAGIDRAIALLNDPRPDVWQPAALYLGAFSKPQAAPYLIRILGRPDVTKRDEIVSDLTHITGKTLDQKYEDWRAWWMQEHPTSTFDFQETSAATSP